MDARTKRIVFGILEFLGEEYNNPLTSADAKESLEVATQCLETAFGVGSQDGEYKSRRTLRELYDDGETGGRTATAAGDINPSESSNLGAQRATDGCGLELGPEYPLPAEASEENKALAEEMKNKGNEAMRNSNYSEAMGHYNKAVELDGRNSVYFCNRAAAFMKLEQYDQSLRDCQIAIRLQPNYARAYGRMGVTYSSRNMHIEAIMCYKKALTLEPNNESYMTNLRYSQTMLAQEAQQDGSSTSGQPPLMGGLENLMRNPNLVNMASQMLRDPAMHQMIQSLMGGLAPNPTPGPPEAGPQAGDGPGAGGLENLMMMGQQIANSLRANNPQLAEQLQLNTGGLNLPGNNGPPNPNSGNNDNAPES